MPHIATDRISRGLRWTGAGLLLIGVALVVIGIGWTRSADALIMTSAVAVLAFGLPGAAAFGLAFWLEHTADVLEHPPATAEARQPAAIPPSLTRNPFREPLPRYAVAIAAAGVAWAARAALDALIPDQVPFITFFLAVTVAGWVGGFGPAALTTALGLVITWHYYVSPTMSPSMPDLGRLVALGLFVFACLGIAAITSALHAALARTQQLGEALHRQTGRNSNREDRFRSLADSLPVPVWMCGRDQEITYFNQAWLRLRGRTLEQESGRGWEEGVHPDDLANRRAAFDEAFRQRTPFSVEYRLRHADGEYRLVRDRGAPRYDDDGAFAGFAGACAEAAVSPGDRAATAAAQGADAGAPP